MIDPARLRAQIEQLPPGPQDSMGQPTVYVSDVLALFPDKQPKNIRVRKVTHPTLCYQTPPLVGSVNPMLHCVYLKRHKGPHSWASTPKSEVESTRRR